MKYFHSKLTYKIFTIVVLFVLSAYFALSDHEPGHLVTDGFDINSEGLELGELSFDSQHLTRADFDANNFLDANGNIADKSKWAQIKPEQAAQYFSTRQFPNGLTAKEATLFKKLEGYENVNIAPESGAVTKTETGFTFGDGDFATEVSGIDGASVDVNEKGNIVLNKGTPNEIVIDKHQRNTNGFLEVNIHGKDENGIINHFSTLGSVDIFVDGQTFTALPAEGYIHNPEFEINLVATDLQSACKTNSNCFFELDGQYYIDPKGTFYTTTDTGEAVLGDDLIIGFNLDSTKVNLENPIVQMRPIVDDSVFYFTTETKGGITVAGKMDNSGQKCSNFCELLATSKLSKENTLARLDQEKYPQGSSICFVSSPPVCDDEVKTGSFMTIDGALYKFKQVEGELFGGEVDAVYLRKDAATEGPPDYRFALMQDGSLVSQLRVRDGSGNEVWRYWKTNTEFTYAIPKEAVDMLIGYERQLISEPSDGTLREYIIYTSTSEHVANEAAEESTKLFAALEGKISAPTLSTQASLNSYELELQGGTYFVVDPRDNSKKFEIPKRWAEELGFFRLKNQ